MQVDAFKAKFQELRNQFMTDKIVDVGLSVMRVADDVASLRGDLTDQGCEYLNSPTGS
jgi:hypothetical protein